MRFDFTWFFFFKQKTAYEMRISDWSSDVCSSDLDPRVEHQLPRRQRDRGVDEPAGRRSGHAFLLARQCDEAAGGRARRQDRRRCARHGHGHWQENRQGRGGRGRVRSEEHTSELQSLMRISYAVFCLKKKNKSSTSHIPKQRTKHPKRQ